jgi:hypothetical protein
MSTEISRYRNAYSKSSPFINGVRFFDFRERRRLLAFQRRALAGASKANSKVAITSREEADCHILLKTNGWHRRRHGKVTLRHFLVRHWLHERKSQCENQSRQSKRKPGGCKLAPKRAEDLRQREDSEKKRIDSQLLTELIYD